MAGITDIDTLLREAEPELDEDLYAFVCVAGEYADYAAWQPLATFREDEGLTLVLRQAVADANGLRYDGAFRRVTLRVHSSLHAVGLTARFAARLAAAGISANTIAAFYHDHIFVPADDAERAMTALANLACRS